MNALEKAITETSQEEKTGRAIYYYIKSEGGEVDETNIRASLALPMDEYNAGMVWLKQHDYITFHEEWV